MSVSTIYQPKKSKNSLSAYVIYGLVVIGLFALAYFGYGFIENISQSRGTAGLSVTTEYGNAEVFINDEFLGTTPFETQEIKAGENKISVRNENIEYEISLNFLANSQVVLNRDLGVSQTFSSGQNFWLEKKDSDTVLSIISEPSNAEVLIDGVVVGQTPFSSKDLSVGAYDLVVQLDGYEPQSARIEINEKFKLNTSVSLFPLPLPERVETLPDSSNVYDVSSSDIVVTSNTQEWAKAVYYWNQTRGVNLAGAGINKEPVFDYLLDYEGQIYNSSADPVAITEFALSSEDSTGAYLRKVSSGEGLTEQAKTTFQAIGTTVVDATMAKILPTGLGWLRVRDVAGLNGTEVTRVDVGNEYEVLEQTAGWVNIKVSDSVNGWVSDTYVEILE